MARRLTDAEAANLLEELTRIELDESASTLERCRMLDELLRESYALASDDELQTFASIASRQYYVHQELNVPPQLAIELEKLLRWLYRTVRERIEFPPAQLHPAFALLREWFKWHRAPEAGLEYIIAIPSLAEPASTLQTAFRFIAHDRSTLHDEHGREIPIINGTIESSNTPLALQLHRRWHSLASVVRRGSTLGVIAPKWISSHVAACTNDTLVILEPDILIDVTTVAECFSGSKNSHLRVLLNMVSYDLPRGETVIGAVVNACFDELLADSTVKPSDAIDRALRTRYLDVLAALNQGSLSLDQIERDVLEHLETLRRVIPHLRGSATTEPMFIAPQFGLQGRIDVLLEEDERPMYKTIIELKSGSPPSQPQRFASNAGATITVGMRPNHLMQISGYNLLLDAAFPGRQGTSQILYSRSSEEPLRNAPNVHDFKADFLAMRNRIVSMFNDFAHRRFRWLEHLSSLDKMDTSPLDHDKLHQFQRAIAELDEQEHLYVRAFLSFAFREWIATMVGTPSRTNGYSALWRLSIDEKTDELRALTYLYIDPSTSNWERGYLTFRFTKQTPSVHPFRAGDIAVLYRHEALSAGDGSIAGQVFKCVVRSLDRTFIEVSLRNKLFDRTMFSAEGLWALDPDVLASGIESMTKALGQFIIADRGRRQLLLGNTAPRTTPRNVPRPPHLTDTQYELLCRALSADDYFLLEGPPGTGKTNRMLRSMVDYLLGNPEETILCTALTNRAVDEICSALKHLWQNGQLLRLGSPDATEHREISLAARAQTDDFERLASLLQHARVIVATVPYLNANQEIFSLRTPTTAIIDEAAQLLEPHLLALAVRTHRMIMIGDVCQLPAVVQQEERGCRVSHPLFEAIELERLDRSLFERLLRMAKRNHWDHAWGRLTEQARMHRLIAHFPGTAFYGTVFRSMQRWQDDAPDLLPYEALPDLLRHRLVFIDTPCESASGYNTTEAKLAAACVCTLATTMSGHQLHEHIGIITPFRKQVRAIAEQLGEAAYEITIDTVERFQGSERDHIIISCAVNSKRQVRLIESLAEIDGRMIDRKLNVALTRARQQVIILGNRAILEQSPQYAALIAFIQEHGIITSAEDAAIELFSFSSSTNDYANHRH